jgi:hypothetical protein
MKQPNIPVLCRLIGRVLSNKHSEKWSLQYTPRSNSILLNRTVNHKTRPHKKYTFVTEKELADCLQRIADRFRQEGYLT